MFDLTSLIAIVPQLLEVVNEKRHIGLTGEGAGGVNKPGRLKVFDALVLDKYRESERLAQLDMDLNIGLGRHSLTVESQKMVVKVSHRLAVDTNRVYGARDPR